MSLIRRWATVAFVFAFVVSLAAPTWAQTRLPQRRAKDATRHSNDAARVLRQIMSVPERAIPRDLLEKAEAVVVCPGVLKAAFIVGGRKGDCVITRRARQGWGPPVFYNLTGGSVGLQVGGDKTDFVLLLMNPEALRGLTEDKFEIGGEAGIAAGPVGRTLSASTNPTLDAGILSYSRSRGAFIGASLKGVAITPDNDLNEAFYGSKASALLAGADAPVPPAVRAFPLQLSRYSVRR
ncbi:MAG TPA: lipid-binding SYLF domain-containing protein [Pyrinomonadaceae bacterium]|nr:lipid-binding SYLF domain-containing protein [Pyrinomonadaceae bacterium]